MNVAPPCLENIPPELRGLDQWVCWRLEPKEDKPGELTKIPYTARNGQKAKAGQPGTWDPFAVAVTAYEESQRTPDPYSGIGFQLADDGGLFGGDLDKCIDPETGEVAEWAPALLSGIVTYTESSPSGTGLRFVGFGTLPPGRRKQGPREMYDRGRFLTITGRRFGDAPPHVADCRDVLPSLHAKMFPPKPKTAPKQNQNGTAHSLLTLSDHDLLAIASRASNGAKFEALWRGDVSGYDGESEADMALCSLLGFYCQGDEGRVERLFSQSQLGQREKWGNREDYRRRTIGAALSGKSEFYTPPGVQGTVRGVKAARAQAVREQSPTVISETINSEAPPPLKRDEHTLTDLGNARRLVDQHGENIRYDHSFGAWFTWDGRRFQQDTTGQIWQRAKATARSIYHEAAECLDDRGRSELAKHAKASEARGRLESMIVLAQTEAEVAVTAEVWDRNPWLLNCRNGTLDLKTGILLPHRREDCCTRLAPVDYDPAAECPLWQKSLARWQPQEDVRDFLQRAVGYSLTGETLEEVLFFTYGQGKNGKSKFTETLQALLSEYGVKAAAETFMLKKSDRGAATPELIALIGRRFVSVSEVEGGQSFSESLLKDMTGGDTMTARPLYRNEINFRPLFKLWFYGNVRPRIDGTDDGIWRRMMLIPFKVTIPKEEQDKHLLPKLLAELPGILNWALAGCRQWQAEGLNPPPSVLSATDEYRQDMDTIGAFLEEKCERAEKYTVRAAEIYEAYTEWSKAAGEKPVTQNAFGHSLTQRGMERFRTGSGFKWRGMALRGPEDDEDDEKGQNRPETVNLVNLQHSKGVKYPYARKHTESYGFSDTQGSQGSQATVEDEELIV